MTTMEINGGMFVIPNDAVAFKTFLLTPFENIMSKFCALNNIELTEETSFIEIIAFSEENPIVSLNSGEYLYNENFAGHGLRIGENTYHHFPSHLPYDLIKNIKEGESIFFKVIVEENCDEGDKKEMLLECTLIADQRTNRYARFGNFDDAVRHVMKKTMSTRQEYGNRRKK